MEPWLRLLLPFGLIFARTTAFLVVLPLFGWASVPRRVKAGTAVLLAAFFALVLPPVPVARASGHWLAAGLLIAQEALCGLALGLGARLIFAAIEQGGTIIGRQMGFALSFIVDPSTGHESRPLGMFLETTFALLFLAVGGHHLLIRLIARSYAVLPAGGGVEMGRLAAGVLAAGSAMLMFALKLAAPLLAAFLILAVVLGVLARVLPEMNVLLTSLPLRVGVGLFLAATLVPMLRSFTDEMARWLNRFL
jgi:flagellar biosynthetic protein FliR